MLGGLENANRNFSPCLVSKCFRARYWCESVEPSAFRVHLAKVCSRMALVCGPAARCRGSMRGYARSYSHDSSFLFVPPGACGKFLNQFIFLERGSLGAIGFGITLQFMRLGLRNNKHFCSIQSLHELLRSFFLNHHRKT